MKSRVIINWSNKADVPSPAHAPIWFDTDIEDLTVLIPHSGEQMHADMITALLSYPDLTATLGNANQSVEWDGKPGEVQTGFLHGKEAYVAVALFPRNLIT